MIFRFTKSAADHIHTTLSGGQKAENRYCDWFVDILNGGDRKKYFLLTNAFSLFSFLIPANGINSADSFLDFAKEEIRDYFVHKNLEGLFLQYIEPNLAQVAITKTNSRSVQGSMNGMKDHIPFAINRHGDMSVQENRFALDDDINRYPSKCANTGADDYIFAEEFISSDVMKQPVPDEPIAVPKKPVQMYQMYAELSHYRPKVWRRFLISPNFDMEGVAFALMVMFNADNSHLYRFEIPVRKTKEKTLKQQGLSANQIEEELYGVRDVELVSYVDEQMDFMDDMFMVNHLKKLPPARYEAYQIKLKKFLSEENTKCTFVYDFGDNWEFTLKVEKTDIQSADRKPRVLEGKGLGIIEDCGGIGGLTEIREAFARKSGEEYENYRKWLGRSEIDLDAFDVDAVNKMLRKI